MDYIYHNGKYEPITEEMRREIEGEAMPDPAEPVTLESLDHRLTDVEYIITGEVATNAQ